MEHHGRRPPKGSFPACPSSGICRAESIRTHTACKNCAISNVSLATILKQKGTSHDLYNKINQNCNVCMDLLTRLIDSLHEPHNNPDFEKVVLLVYKLYGHGNVSDRYINATPAAPRPTDPAHARMILEELGLTCYDFNSNTTKCIYIEDIIYCKRHTPVLTVNALDKLCKKYERAQRRRKRKRNSTITISSIKSSILQHERNLKNINERFKEIPLRKRFNAWLEHLSKKKK